jgi:hypothetical protein
MQSGAVTNDLQALALCVSYNVEYVMYGIVTPGTAAGLYSADVNLYSRGKHAVILNVRYSAEAPTLRAFAADLAAETHRQVLRSVLLAPGDERVAAADTPAPATVAAEPFPAPPASQPPVGSPPVEPAPTGPAPAAGRIPPVDAAPGSVLGQEARQVDSETAPSESVNMQDAADRQANEQERLSPEQTQGVKSKKPGKGAGSDPVTPQDPEESAEERVLGLGLHVAAGYYLNIREEWKEAAAPRASTDAGLKLTRRLHSGEAVQLWMRPYLMVNYAFASNRPTDPVVHHHSLSPRFGVEMAFVGLGRFNLTLGTGVHYRVDIIDYQTPLRDFTIDIAYAAGISASAGVEFALDSDRSTLIGLTNLADLTFFEERRIRNAFLVGATFYRTFLKKRD